MTEPIPVQPIKTAPLVSAPIVEAHPIEELVKIPAVPGLSDMPRTPDDPKVPKYALTAEEIAWAMKTAGDLFPSLKKHWAVFSAIVAVLVCVAGSLGYYVAPAAKAPADQVKHVDPKMQAPLQVDPPKDVVVNPPVPGSVGEKRIVLFLTTADKAPDKLPKSVSVRSGKAEQPGSTITFNHADIPLPCMVLYDSAGKILDVRHFGSVAEIEAFASFHK